MLVFPSKGILMGICSRNIDVLIFKSHAVFLFSLVVLPVPCQTSTGIDCFCHHNLVLRANIYNCSMTEIKMLPALVSNNTEWFLADGSYVTDLCEYPDYLRKLTSLSLKNNKVARICESFVDKLTNDTDSKLNQMGEIWLSGNPFHCNCEMTWMTDWLNTFTAPSGEHIVVDFKNITCQAGSMKGTPIYELNEVLMGCFPSKWRTWQKVLVGIGAATAAIVIIVLIVMKRSRKVRFLLYYHLKLNTLDEDDKTENVDNMRYDAFFCFW